MTEERNWGTISLILVAFFAVRGGLMLFFHVLLGGQEFTDDVDFFIALGHQPLAILLGNVTELPRAMWNHPPLMGLFMVPIVPLAELLGDFVGPRVLYVLFEAGCFLILAIWFRRPRLIATLVLLAALPGGWMTTVVFAQEEFLPGFFVLVAAMALASDHPRASLLSAVAMVFAILGGKIFAALPLVMFLPLLWRRRRKVLWLAGGLSGVVVTFWVSCFLLKSGAFPIVGTAPNASFSMSLPGVVGAVCGVSPHLLKMTTALLVVGIVVTLLIIFGRRASESWETSMLLAVVVSLSFLILFYHTNPEYFAIIAPLFAVATAVSLSRRGWLAAWVLFLVGSSGAWGVNIFFGLRRGLMPDLEGKAQLTAMYLKILPAWTLDVGWWTCLVLCTAATMGVISVIMVAVRREVGGVVGADMRPPSWDAGSSGQ